MPRSKSLQISFQISSQNPIDALTTLLRSLTLYIYVTYKQASFPVLRGTFFGGGALTYGIFYFRFRFRFLLFFPVWLGCGDVDAG